MDFLDRMRQNRCQLKFCCSRWFAWAILCYLLQGQSSTAGCNLAAEIRLLSQGWRYKGTCFTLMANAFLNNISCTECRSLQMYLFCFFFSYLESHLCPTVQFSNLRQEGRGNERRNLLSNVYTTHQALCKEPACVWTFIYSHAIWMCLCWCCVLFIISVMSFFFFLAPPGLSALTCRIIGKSLHCMAPPTINEYSQLVQYIAHI